MRYIFEPRKVACVPVRDSDEYFPVHRIYCVGSNYADHVREMGGTPEQEPPIFFSKPADAVHFGPTLPYPPMTKALHHEVELVVALGAGGSNIPKQQASSLVFGYATGVDLTRRDLQTVAKKYGQPWDVAKGFDCSAPVSTIKPVDGNRYPQRGAISLSVNGVPHQTGDLAQMIWPVPDIISELSRYYQLRPGDLIFTGTPAGVGVLEPGDCVDCDIEGVGSLSFRLESA